MNFPLPFTPICTQYSRRQNDPLASLIPQFDWVSLSSFLSSLRFSACWLGPPCQTSVSVLTRVRRLSCIGVPGIPSQPVTNFFTSSVLHPPRAFCETLSVSSGSGYFLVWCTPHFTRISHFYCYTRRFIPRIFMSSTPAVGTLSPVTSPVSSNAPSLPPTPSPSGVNTVSLLTAVTTSPTPSTSAPVTTSAFSEQSQQPSACVHIQLLRLLCMNHSQHCTNHDVSNHCGYYRDTVVGKSIRTLIYRSPHFCKRSINVLFHTVCDNCHLEQ